MKWYIVRERGAKYWTAYLLSPGQIENLGPEFEHRGPFNYFVQALMASFESDAAPDLPSTPKRKTQMQSELDEVSVVDMTDLAQ